MPEIFVVAPLPGGVGAISVNTEGYQDLLNLPPQWREAAKRELDQAMRKSLRLMLTTLIPKIPEDEGHALRSLAIDYAGVSVADSMFEGSITSDLDYMKNLEFGRRPGTWPPISEIAAWAERKGLSIAGGPAGNYTQEDIDFGYDPEGNPVRFRKDRSVAFIIARAIRDRGIPGRHMFQDTADQTRPQVELLFRQAIANALNDVTSSPSPAPYRTPTGSALSILRSRGLID